MQPSDPSKLVESLLNEEGDDLDPKEYVQSTHVGSPLFEEFMGNYRDAVAKLLEQAQRSGAVPEGTPEGILIRAVMQIAAKNFWWDQPQYRKLLRNLERFI